MRLPHGALLRVIGLAAALTVAHMTGDRSRAQADGSPGRTPLEQAKQVMASLENEYEKVMQSYLRAHPGAKLVVDTPHAESPRWPGWPGSRGSHGSLENLAPDIPRTVIDGASEWPRLDSPEKFNGILDEFIATRGWDGL